MKGVAFFLSTPYLIFGVPLIILWMSPVWWAKYVAIITAIIWGAAVVVIAYSVGKEEGCGIGHKVDKEELGDGYQRGYESGFDDAINRRNMVIKQG